MSSENINEVPAIAQAEVAPNPDALNTTKIATPEELEPNPNLVPAEGTNVPDGTPAFATSISDGYAQTLEAIAPEAVLTQSQVPSPDAPVTHGFISTILDGIKHKLEPLREKYASVDAAFDDIEATANEELLLALKTLEEAKQIAITGLGKLPAHAADIVRDVALDAIPHALRADVTSFFTSAFNKVEDEYLPAAQGIAVAIQHGIFKLRARVS